LFQQQRKLVQHQAITSHRWLFLPLRDLFHQQVINFRYILIKISKIISFIDSATKTIGNSNGGITSSTVTFQSSRLQDSPTKTNIGNSVYISIVNNEQWLPLDNSNTTYKIFNGYSANYVGADAFCRNQSATLPVLTDQTKFSAFASKMYDFRPLNKLIMSKMKRSC